MSKDYIIFDNAPTLVFNTTVPFTCEADFSDAASWYKAQSRDTAKPRPKIFGSILTSNCDSQYALQDISANLSVHGNYTAYYRQKSFKLHLDSAQNLFGLNKGAAAKDWILLADYGDNSKLRNALALYIGQQFFRGSWAATFTPVHIYIDGEYYGLYLLTDAKKVAPTRININEPEEGYTGVDIGYLFERDDYLTYDHKDPGFVIQYPDEYLPQPLPIIDHETNKSYGVDATYRDEYSISSNIYNQNQIDFLKKFTCLVYTIMYEACVNNQYYEINSTDIADWQNWELVQSQLIDPIEVLSKVIDINSFVDTYLLHEFAGNPDLAHSSFYLYVDMSSTGNKKLTLCCPWDFDRAFGISNGLGSAGFNFLWVKGAHYNPWVSVLPQAEWFINLLKARYQELAANDVFTKLVNMLDDYSTTYQADYAKNYQKYSIHWEGDLPGWVPNGSPATIGTLNTAYYANINTEAEAEALLKKWVLDRTEALNNIFNPEPEPVDPTGELQAPKIIFACDTDISEWYMANSRWSERPKITGTISTADCADEFILTDLEAELKVRGNYTADYSKKPFQIKFANKQNLFGLNDNNKHKKWVLLAEYTDGSMLRNATALFLAQQLFKDTGVWVPTFTYAHFYIQDANQLYYMGLFLVADQKEQAKKRINVFEPDGPSYDEEPAEGEERYTGTDIGYFFERDDYFQTETDPTFSLTTQPSWDGEHWVMPDYVPAGPSSSGHESNAWGRQVDGSKLRVDGYSIKSKITDLSQVAFLKDRLLKIYTILYYAANENTAYVIDGDSVVPTTAFRPQEAVAQVIDINSFVNRYILEEIICNPDLPHSSFNLSLDMSAQGNKLLTLACPWDYDRAFGSTKTFALDPTLAGLWAKDCTLNPWISLLAKTDWFKELVDARWQELYDNYIFRKTLNFQNEISLKYAPDFAKNYTEWSIHYKTNATWNNGTYPNGTILYPEIDTEYGHKRILQTWVDNRFIILHELFNGQGSTDWPDEPTPIPEIPGPGTYYCIEDNGKKILVPTHLFGSVKVIVGQQAIPSNIAKIVYNLNKNINGNSIRLDLETGRHYLEEFDGYTSWFPGSHTYGIIQTDGPIYQENDTTSPVIGTVRAWGQGEVLADSTVEILTILDNVNTDPVLKNKVGLYKIKAPDGTVGYIYPAAVGRIYYKAKLI